MFVFLIVDDYLRFFWVIVIGNDTIVVGAKRKLNRSVSIKIEVLLKTIDI